MNISHFFPTQWLQVWGLAGVQGAITISWVIYGLYLPKLLEQFGLPPTMAGAIFAIEAAIAILMEPLMGWLSDNAQNRLGTRLPFITFGIILSSALFIAIPSMMIFGGTSEIVRWIFLGVIVAWSIAMTIFRTPTMVLLGKFAFGTQLPQAASILTLVGGIAGSMRSLSSKFILSFGPAVTFTVGSIMLLGAGAFLRMVVDRQSSIPNSNLNSFGVSDADKTESDKAEAERNRDLSEPSPPFKTLALLAAIGLTIAWGVRLTMGEILPRVFEVQISIRNLDILVGTFSIALSVFALAAGFIANRFGNIQVMSICAGLVAACLGLLSVSHGVFAVITISTFLVASLSGVLNGAIPLALNVMPKRLGGLGIGMYFGGSAAAGALFGYLFPKPAEMLSFQNAILMAAIAFLLAGIAIAIAAKPRKN